MARLAAVAVLAIFVHVLLMASGGAEAAPHPAPPLGHDTGSGPSIDCPDHGARCFTTQPVVLTAPGTAPSDHVVVPLPLVWSANTGLVPPAGGPPHPPPDVARAFLQVYRI